MDIPARRRIPLDRQTPRLAKVLGALSIVAALAAVTACSGAPASGASGEALKLADSYSTTHFFARYGTTDFIEEITAEGEGAIDIEYYPSGQLGSARDIVELAESGTLDIVPAAAAYVADKLPLSSVTDLPGLTEDPCVASQSLRDLLAEDGILYQEEYEPRGLRPIYLGVIPSYEIMTTSTPVESPEDLEGLTIRSGGGAMDRNIASLGGAPVSMPASEAYEALSRHTVDGISFAYASITPYALEEVLRYSTKGLNGGSFALPYVVSEKAWQKLDPAQQERLTAAGEAASDALCRGIGEEKPASEELMREAGMEITELDDAQRAAFAEHLDPVRTEWAEDFDAVGRPGTDVLEAYEEAIARNTAAAEGEGAQ